MSINALIRLAATLLVAALVATHSSQADETPAGEASPDSSGARAIAAIKDARRAARELARALKSDERLTESDFKQLANELESLHHELEPIWKVYERQQFAKRNPDKPIESVPEQREQTRVWVEQMRSLGPNAKAQREQAIAEMRSALESDDRGRQYAALTALQQVGDVNYDKAALRPLILPFVKHAKGHTFAAAAYALHHTGRQSGDLELVQDAWKRRTAALDGSISHLLFTFTDGKLDSRSEEIILDLLSSDEANTRREGLRGLWGASVSDKLAARLIELADDPETRHDAIYFGLSTLKPKSDAVVDKLIETLSDSDRNDWGRALWGLGFGVPEELRPKVVTSLREMYEARSDARTREQIRAIVSEYGGPTAVDDLPD